MKCLCPICGSPLDTMEPFYDTLENEWNYHCEKCNLDITIFARDDDAKEEPKRPHYWDVIGWISEHKGVWEDFKSYFNVTDNDME